MNVSILGGRPYFWQWDTNQKLLVDDPQCQEVHFCQVNDETALVVRLDRLDDGRYIAPVPNILLQKPGQMIVYLCWLDSSGAETRKAYRFSVHARQKPDNYVYTETDILNYAYVDRRMTALEEKAASGAFTGPQGPVGPTGPQGPSGPQGNPGLNAPQIRDDIASSENPYSGAKVEEIVGGVRQTTYELKSDFVALGFVVVDGMISQVYEEG